MDKLTFRPISSQPISLAKSKKQSIPVSGQGFNHQLRQAVEANNSTLNISKHAKTRMAQRNIDIDAATWSKIESKIQQAKKMGVTDSLVLTENAAFVVSAKNNTVITVMDRLEASLQIFTNINGTILID